MGYPIDAALVAVRETECLSVTAAVEFLIAHPELTDPSSSVSTGPHGGRMGSDVCCCCCLFSLLFSLLFFVFVVVVAVVVCFVVVASAVVVLFVVAAAAIVDCFVVIVPLRWCVTLAHLLPSFSLQVRRPRVWLLLCRRARWGPHVW